MTVIDLILLSKGITVKGDINNILIYRSTFDETRKNPMKSFKVSLNEDFSKINNENNPKLQENDLVVVREKLGYQEKEFIKVEGLVKYPGTYAIKNNYYSFYEFIQVCGGFLNDASLSGVKIIRENKLAEVLKNNEGVNPEEQGKDEEEEIKDSESIKLLGLSSKDSVNLKVEINPFIEFGVDINNLQKTRGLDPKFNVVLKPNDQIIVPRKDNTVEVTGAVQQSSAVTFSKSLTTISAINSAGGFKENAKKNSVYVVYQNGNIASTKSFLFFTIYPKLKPGAKIIVPEKNTSRSRTSAGEIVGYTTSLVSIIALIKNL